MAKASVSVHNPFYCYTEDPIRPQIGMFATKSAYETSRGQKIDRTLTQAELHFVLQIWK
jgi:hypothetical protein